MSKNYIYILPMGNIGLEFFENLKNDLKGKFEFKVRIEEKIDIPDYAYDKDRDQYNGRIILNESESIRFKNAEKILVIAPIDLFTEDLNFIFGQAESSGKVCLISTKRLNPEFYKEKLDKDLFYNRILKEAAHELGHTFGLKHCKNKKCVMHFSNSIEDTDLKNDEFCEGCKKIYKYMRT